MGACSSVEEPKPVPQAHRPRPSLAQQPQFVDLPVDKQSKPQAAPKPKANVITFGDEGLVDSSDDEAEERPYVMSSTFAKEQAQLSSASASAARSKGKMTAAEAAAINNKNKMSAAEAAAAAKAAIAEAQQAIKNAEEREAKEKELEQEREKERQKEQEEQQQRAQQEEQRRQDEMKRQQENEAKLKAKQQHMLDMLVRGHSFTKHGRKGKPHARVVRYISAPKRVIDYSSGSIPLSEIQSVSAGKNSAVFRSVKDSVADPKVCFSLLCQQRTLDLQAESEAVRNEWIEALTFLLSPESNGVVAGASASASAAAASLPVATMHLPPTSSPTPNLEQAESKQPHSSPSHSPSSSVSPSSAPAPAPASPSSPSSPSHSPKASISPASAPPSLPLGPLGQTFIKHGRKGSPHPRIIKLWIKGVPGDKIDYQSGHILFKDIQTVQAGKQTKVWARVSEKHALASHCFSIVTASRTLDLEADTQKQRDEWVTGLLALMKQYHYRR